jgi:4-hydroxybenzoate polyprenyltransferase
VSFLRTATSGWRALPTLLSGARAGLRLLPTGFSKAGQLAGLAAVGAVGVEAGSMLLNRATDGAVAEQHPASTAAGAVSETAGRIFGAAEAGATIGTAKGVAGEAFRGADPTMLLLAGGAVLAVLLVMRK